MSNKQTQMNVWVKIYRFLFPKHFMKELRKGMDNKLSQIQHEKYSNTSVTKLGMDRVKRRGDKWFNFFMWLPIVGNVIFYIEGKKEAKLLKNKVK